MLWVSFDIRLQQLVDLARKGNASSDRMLLEHAHDRLMVLTRSIFRDFPSLRRWEQTEDVFQNSMIRMQRALSGVKVESARHFLNLAALQIRRELHDLTRKYFGPLGVAANHHSDHQPSDNPGGALHSIAAKPENLSQWTDFHAAVERLPPEELEVFNLVYYEGLTQEEAAPVLGLSLRTLKRLWQSAKVRLHGESILHGW